MKKVPFCICTSLFLLTFWDMSAVAENTWNLIKDGQGIKIFTRHLPGSALDEFKGTTEIEAPLEVLHCVLLDIPRFTEWFGSCSGIEILETLSPEHYYVYLQIQSYWPVSNRDVYMDVRYYTDHKLGDVYITIDSMRPPEKYVKKSTCVRMAELKASCSLKKISADKTFVDYKVTANPAGSIPNYLANKFACKQPYDTLEGLRRMAAKIDGPDCE